MLKLSDVPMRPNDPLAARSQIITRASCFGKEDFFYTLRMWRCFAAGFKIYLRQIGETTEQTDGNRIYASSSLSGGLPIA
jgi:hypothetical protein